MAMLLVIAFSLLLLDYSASTEIFKQCTDGKRNVLNTEPAVINYTTNNENITCEWTIATTVTENGYAVILWLETLQLRDQGTVEFPGATPTYQCNSTDLACRNHCWMYTSNMPDCNMNVSCNNVKFWEDIAKPRAIKFTSQKSNKLNSGIRWQPQVKPNSSFIIHYYPIKCNATATTMENLLTSTISQGKDKFPTTGTTLRSMTPLNSTLLGLVVGGVGGLLIALSVVAVIVCCKKYKSPNTRATSTQQDSAITSHLPTRSKKTYVNCVKTTDEAGYEIPTNARQYENLNNDGQYENLKDDDMYEDVEDDTTYANTELSVA